MNKRDQDEYFKQQIYDYVKLSNHSKKERRDKILDEFYKVKNRDKAKIKEIIYPVLRDEISYAFTIPDYYEVVKSFEEIKKTDCFKNEMIGNKIIIYNMLIKAHLFLYLDNQRKNRMNLTKAKNFFEYVSSKNFERELSHDQYTLEKKNFEINKEFLNSIENDKLWTEINFTLPFPLGISETETEFIIDNISVFLKTKKFNVSNSRITFNKGTVGEMTRDKYGLYTRTEVSLKINDYLSSEIVEKLYHYDGDVKRTEAQINSLNILNRIISRFRLIKNNYWIDNVDIKMIDVNSVVVYADDIEIKNILFQMSDSFKISNNFEYNDSSRNELLQELLSLDDNEILWLELLADSKNYLLMNKLRESIISLNSAFENFFYSRMKEIFYINENKSKIDAFFEGETPYSEVERIISENEFSELKDLGFFPNYVPPVNQIVNKYFDIVPEEKRISISKTQMKKSIGKIRKYRNEIVHGNLAVKLSSKHVYDAIKRFETLSSEIEKAHFLKNSQK